MILKVSYNIPNQTFSNIISAMTNEASNNYSSTEGLVGLETGLMKQILEVMKKFTTITTTMTNQCITTAE